MFCLYGWQSFLNDPAHWGERAEEARTRADQMSDLSAEAPCFGLLMTMSFSPIGPQTEPREAPQNQNDLDWKGRAGRSPGARQ